MKLRNKWEDKRESEEFIDYYLGGNFTIPSSIELHDEFHNEIFPVTRFVFKMKETGKAPRAVYVPTFMERRQWCSYIIYPYTRAKARRACRTQLCNSATTTV